MQYMYCNIMHKKTQNAKHKKEEEEKKSAISLCVRANNKLVTHNTQQPLTLTILPTLPTYLATYYLLTTQAAS